MPLPKFYHFSAGLTRKKEAGFLSASFLFCIFCFLKSFNLLCCILFKLHIAHFQFEDTLIKRRRLIIGIDDFL